MSAFGFKSIFIPTGRGIAHAGGMGGDGSQDGGGGPSGPSGAYGRALNLNTALQGSGWSYNNYSTIINKIQEYQFMVIATPRYGAMAESMGQQNPVTGGGYFYRQEFASGNQIENSAGFPNDTYNGIPFLGMVGWRDSTYYGIQFNFYRDYGSRDLRGLFYPVQWRNLYTFVINANGSERDEGSSSARTYFSDNSSQGSNGYYQDNRFSADDGVWGCNMIGDVNGDSPGPRLNNNSGYSYGCENYHAGDSSGPSQYFYWGGQYSSTSYTFFVFRGTA